MLVKDLIQINEYYYKIEDAIANLLEDEADVFPYYDLAVHDKNCRNIFNSCVLNKKECLLLYNPFTKNYKIEDLDFVKNYLENNNNIIHITEKGKFREFWYNLITDKQNNFNKDIYIDDSVINDIVMDFFSEIEYFKEYIDNYTPVNLQLNNKNIYIYIDAYNCNKIKNVKVSPRITFNVYADFILKENMIKSIYYAIKAYLDDLRLEYFKVYLSKKHITFIKENNEHFIYFAIIFETDKLIDLINMHVLADYERFSCLREQNKIIC